MKIAIIMPYFGKWPKWMSFFLKSCETNKDFNWILYTDCGKPEFLPDNVKIIDATLEGFNDLASTKLGMEIQIKSSYKLCELKPAYGIIFSDLQMPKMTGLQLLDKLRQEQKVND